MWLFGKFSSTSENKKENKIPQFLKKNQISKNDEITYYANFYLGANDVLENHLEYFEKMFEKGDLKEFENYLKIVGKIKNDKKKNVIFDTKGGEEIPGFFDRETKYFRYKVLSVMFELKAPRVDNEELEKKIRSYFENGKLPPFIKVTFYINLNPKNGCLSHDLKHRTFDLREIMQPQKTKFFNESRKKMYENESFGDFKISYNKL